MKTVSATTRMTMIASIHATILPTRLPAVLDRAIKTLPCCLLVVDRAADIVPASAGAVFVASSLRRFVASSVRRFVGSSLYARGARSAARGRSQSTL
jgi:hypothetical protein